MIQIREGKPEDVATIVRFQLAMANETEGLELNPVVVEKGVKSVFDDPGKGRYFVAESKKKVVASLLITFEWSDWRNATVYWMQSVYVLPEFRKKGVFGKMYRYIQNIVHEKDEISGIRLYVDSENLAAQEVYKKLGMNGEHYHLFEWMKAGTMG